MKKIIKYIRYALEATALIFGLLLFRLMPLDIASLVGGWLARVFGVFTKAHKIAEANIAMAMPELPEKERDKIIRDMWDNFGRVIGEYPHLTRKIMQRRIIIEGREHLEAAKKSGKGIIFVSGHFANWETIPLAAHICGMPLVVVYRAANNPISDWLISKIRASYNVAMYAKGIAGARQMMKSLKSGASVAMLIDQKLNEGAELEFFGHKAMTSTAATQLAIKMGTPLIAARVVRTDGVYFHVSVEPARIYPPETNPEEAMQELNLLFESWIRKQPAQWFWVHRRWKVI